MIYYKSQNYLEIIYLKNKINNLFKKQMEEPK